MIENILKARTKVGRLIVIIALALLSLLIVRDVDAAKRDPCDRKNPPRWCSPTPTPEPQQPDHVIIPSDPQVVIGSISSGSPAAVSLDGFGYTLLPAAGNAVNYFILGDGVEQGQLVSIVVRNSVSGSYEIFADGNANFDSLTGSGGNTHIKLIWLDSQWILIELSGLSDDWVINREQ